MEHPPDISAIVTVGPWKAISKGRCLFPAEPRDLAGCARVIAIIVNRVLQSAARFAAFPSWALDWIIVVGSTLLFPRRVLKRGAGALRKHWRTKDGRECVLYEIKNFLAPTASSAVQACWPDQRP